MKKIYRSLAARITFFILLVLDWAALDDIMTGNEPDYFGEYSVLFASLILFGIMIYKRNLWIARK